VLSKLHSHKIAHNDLSLTNIMVKNNGKEIVLIDLGLALMFGSEAPLLG